MKRELIIHHGAEDSIRCSEVIVVPGRAVSEPGYIRVLGGAPDGPDKHAVHALAQTACYRYQDDDLTVAELAGPCRIEGPAITEELNEGMIIYRQTDGMVGAAAHVGLNRRKMLEAAHRYCTRWVRLDL